MNTSTVQAIGKVINGKVTIITVINNSIIGTVRPSSRPVSPAPQATDVFTPLKHMSSIRYNKLQQGKQVHYID